MSWRIVGNDDCSFNDVVTILESVCSKTSTLNWNGIARRLNIENAFIDKLRHDIILEKRNALDALYETLIEWRSREGNKATIEKLAQAVDHASTAEILLEAFPQVITMQTKWSGLNEKMHSKLLSKRVIFQGISQTLQDFQKNCWKSSLSSLMAMQLKNCSFLEIIASKKEFEISSDTLPKLMPFYIAREIQPNNCIDLQMFSSDCSDVFVFQNIEWSKLTCIANNSTTDRSSGQLKQITVRFILLDFDDDFDILAKMTNTPIHKIYHHDGSFYWIKSSGGLDNLRKYVSHRGIHSESSFIESSIKSTREPVLISATPGMGKSTLLAHIAKQIRTKYLEKLVIFITFRDIVNSISVYTKQLNTCQVQELIVKHAAASEWGELILLEMIQNQSCEVALFLDGFDELMPEEISIATQLLNIIQQNFIRTKLFVATRPHLRQTAEDILNVFAHQIQPFEECHQIEYFLRCWEMNFGAENNKTLQDFATTILKQLKSNLNQTDQQRNIAGIPLQCSMLADLYGHDARKVSKAKSVPFGFVFSATSIFEMYENFIKIKLDTEESKLFHVDAAIKLLFPGWADKLEPLYLQGSSLPSKVDMYKIGLLEPNAKSHVSRRPRFVHTTYAEFLLAEFVVNAIQNFEDVLNSELAYLSDYFSLFLYKAVLRTSKPIKNTSNNNLSLHQYVPYFEFRHPVVAYFINCRLSAHTDNPTMLVNMKQLQIRMNSYRAGDRVKFVYRMMACVAISDLGNLYNLCTPQQAIGAYKIFTWVHSKWADILLLAASYSSTSLFGEVCAFVESLEGEKLQKIKFRQHKFSNCDFTPLHVSVQKGRYKMTEYLLKKYDHHWAKIPYLLHFCVVNTKFNESTVISRKLEIIKLLAQKNKALVNERIYGYGIPPLCMKNVHIEILKCLIINGSDATAEVNGNDGSTCAHNAFTELSPIEFHEFATFIVYEFKNTTMF